MDIVYGMWNISIKLSKILNCLYLSNAKFQVLHIDYNFKLGCETIYLIRT